MVDHNIYWQGQAFQIVLPISESFEYFQHFFVMDIIVEFSTQECSEVEGYWIYFTF